MAQYTGTVLPLLRRDQICHFQSGDGEVSFSLKMTMKNFMKVS